MTPLPAQPEALAAFLAERAEAGLHVATLDAYCSGIAHRHGQEGLPDPTAHVVVRRVRRGLRRIMGVAPRRQAHPLTVAELGQIVASIDAGTAIGKRDRAILLVGYASVMRPGEISALNIDDVLCKPTGALLAFAGPRPIRRPVANSSASLAARTRSLTRSERSTTGFGTLLNHYIRPAEAMMTTTSRDLGL